jgi:hypothetical protein
MINSFRNLEVGQDYALIELNCSLYNLKDIKRACLRIMNRHDAMIMLDGDEESYFVDIQCKKPEKVAKELMKLLYSGNEQ